MRICRGRWAVLGLSLLLLTTGVMTVPAEAQRPGALPPADSPPMVRAIEFNFDAQGGVPNVDIETYLYYAEITNHVSSAQQGRWVPYTEEIEQILLDDFERLWDTGFLDDLKIDVRDFPYENGVMGKHIIYRFEERQRVKIVTFEGSDELDRTKIDTALQETGLVIRLDSFLDLGKVRQVEGLLGAMFSAEGFQFAEVDHEITELAGGPKTVQLTFNMSEGPKVQVHDIEFVGNDNIDDGDLKGQMEHIKERWFLSWITGRGTYKEALFAQDADKIQAYYMGQGYIDANIGSPETDYLEVSEDGKSRGMRLRIPIDEGDRYRVGDVRFDGNQVITEAGMRSIFGGLEEGDFYSQETVVGAMEAAREVYGSLGYTGAVILPDLQRRNQEDAAVGGDMLIDASVDVGDGLGEANDPYAALQRPTHVEGNPVVDVTLRIEEGEQQFVNRITFVGNDSTHDEVIRREMQLVENGVFSTSALKNSIRRLNQLGYFEPLEEDQVDINNVDGSDNEVDLMVNLTETNLNQLTFGAGVSQFDGFFGQMAFSTTNFLGRGETLSVSVQSGSRLRDINLGYTRPYLFGKNLSGGVNLYSRRIEWIGAYTEETTGGSLTFGWPLALFTRMFLTYSLEETGVRDINPFLVRDPDLLAGNPFFQDALLLGLDGRRTISKIAPSIRFNTVDHPIFPNSGKSYAATMEIAGLGGNTRFWKPVLEARWYIPHTRRTTIGIRGQYQFINAANPAQIPVFERLWLGGEYSVRGFDIRRIGPHVSDLNPEIPDNTFQGRTVIGGNKSLLFNAEYQFAIANPVRLIAFYDAGQVQDFGHNFDMHDFKTSTGLEFRFFMPMLNVPFRLIYSWNPQRDGIYNDNLQPQEETTFRFAVGSTF